MGDQDQVASEAQAITSVNLDASKPVTNIQIRLADGGRLVQKFNHTHRSVMKPWSSTSPPLWRACPTPYYLLSPHHFSSHPQGVRRASVCGGSSPFDGGDRVCAHDNLPQQGADWREPVAAGCQPAQRSHCAAAKVMEPPGGLAGSQLFYPPWGMRHHGLMDFFFFFFYSDDTFSLFSCLRGEVGSG